MGDVVFLTAGPAVEHVVCWAHEGCGVHFAVDAALMRNLRSRGGSFYCPKGHHLGFGESDADKVRRELESTKKRLEWMERDRDIHRDHGKYQERRAASARGHATRLRKRIAAGQCPCCSETFADVAKHIAAKHPKYMPADKG